MIVGLQLHSIRRIGEDHVGFFAVHEFLDVLRVGGVTAEEAMVAEDPEVTWFGDGFFWGVWDFVWVSVAFFRFEFGNG